MRSHDYRPGMTFTQSSAVVSGSSATRRLASALVDLREARELKIHAVCKSTGLSNSVVSNAEVAGTPKFGVLVVLAEFYGFDETSGLVALGEMDPTERREQIKKHFARLDKLTHRWAA